jgi:hypothetical protein
MKNCLKLSLLTLNLFAFSAIACDIHGHSGILPENKLNIPVGLKSLGGINETQFNRVMDKMILLYSPVIAKTGKKFVIERRWTDGTVNAYAEQNTPGVDAIHMFGGLARHPETTEDAMVLVACHELGHHIGGAPKKTDPDTGLLYWASNEGQADYWGAMKCLRHYFESEKKSTAAKNQVIAPDVIQQCNSHYVNANEIAMCERSAMAGLALAKVLNSVMQGKTDVNFTTPDKAVVYVTFDSHPQSQCRLDTFYQAALCDHGFSETVSQTDANIGVCSKRNGDKIGNRPLCWYKP